MNATPETPQAILKELRARGMELAVAEGNLWYRPVDAMTESLATKVAAHKRSLIALLSGQDPCEIEDWCARAHSLIQSCADASVRSDLQDAFEETAAKLHFDQGLEAEDAEMQAFGQLLFRFLQLGLDAKASP